MQKECMIVRDLFPNYMENLTGDATNVMIKEHLEDCPDCQEFYKKLERDSIEEQEIKQEAEQRFKRILQRYRYQLFGGFIGVAFTIVIFILLVKCGINMFHSANYEKGHTEEVSEYGVFEGYSGLSKLTLFPTDVQLKEYGAEVKQYYFDCSGPKLYQNCEIYAECKFDEKSFIREIQRLKGIRSGETGRASVYDETDYEFPAVYTMRNAEGCNEYALLRADELKIIYIYLQGTVDRRDIHFSEAYLPPDYGQDGMNFEEVEEYTIYENENEKIY